MIVQRDAGGAWRDDIGRDWSAAVRFDLPDEDVFEIDADTLAELRSFTGVGTILFNMAVNPANGKLYVSNLESRNLTRFEGPGIVGGSTVQGHLAEARIAIVSPTATVSRHLNKHIDYSVLASDPGFDPSAKDHSLATPLGIAFSRGRRDGVRRRLRLGPHRGVPGVGPRGRQLRPRCAESGLHRGARRRPRRTRPRRSTRASLRGDALRQRHLGDRPRDAQRATAPRCSTTPSRRRSSPAGASSTTPASARRTARRPARPATSSGTSTRSAWDLGNPDEAVTTNPIPKEAARAVGIFPSPINGTGNVNDFHPMKGPMTTQTLRGLARSGAMHWRGDRSNGCLRNRRLRRGALLRQLHRRLPGAARARDAAERAPRCRQFTDFALEIALPPNPVRAARQPAERRPAGRPRLLPGPRALRHALQLQRLPHASTRRTASSAPTAGPASRTSRRS